MENILDTAFYQDDDTCRWHIRMLANQGYRVDNRSCFYLMNNLDDFISSHFSRKIALYHTPYPPETTWLDRFEETYRASDLNIVICSELHEATVDQLISLDRPRVAMFVCGHIEHEFQHARVGKFMDWFIMPTHFYTKLMPNLLREKLSPQENKPKMFDVLLGLHREHRQFVYDHLNGSDIKDQVVMTYHRSSLEDNSKFIYEPEIEFMPDKKLNWTIDNVMYYGYEKSLSMIVPITIYNQTYYSLVAETNYFNHFNFYTEKIVKPLMAGRLFVAIAGQHYLKNLRGMGYQTFDSIIDESYDLEADQEVRWTMALAQVRALCERDPREVYRKIGPVIEHNKKLILDKDWYDEFSKELRAVLLDHTRQN
jgi:hypothetical protein